MKTIIPPVDKALLVKELTKDKFVRNTNYGHNELYIFSHNEAPNLMKEIGRLRELTFRHAGGGTGEDVDLDEFDLSEDPYQQLIVWDPKHQEILGGYRFYIPPKGASGDYIMKRLSTSHLFKFSDKCKDEYLPRMIELGRSFVQPNYQSTSRPRKGLFALDNLWDGLGALLVDNPDMRYFFGKVTMYTHFNIEARNLILFFLEKHFSDKEGLITPIEPLETNINREKLSSIFTGDTYYDDYKILSKQVRTLGENIPPLINAYMNLSPSMRVFGTVINPEFGNVEETGIMITINDLYHTKVERHVSTYQRVKYYIKKERDKFF